MSITPHTIDIVVADMGASLAFYKLLGLNLPATEGDEQQVQITTPGGATLGLVTETLVRRTNPSWVDPIGQRVTFACRCDSPDEVDAVYRRMTNSGHEGRKEPWDAVWGQRYAMLGDPDGNRVDLFSPITEEGRE